VANFPRRRPTDELGFPSQPDALGVGEALGFAAALFKENAILFLEVFDDRLLVSAHPAGDRDQEELELNCHKVENPSKVPTAQSSMWSRLGFLVVQEYDSTSSHPAKLTLLEVCDTVRHMKTVTIRELHAKTGELVRDASRHGHILVTDNGKTIAKIVPETNETGVPYFANRKPSTAFGKLDGSGKTGRGTDATQLISEDREDRV
jgi:prevent-host-death family protein